MNINPRKETKSHAKNNGLYATKADLKDTEHHLNIEILATKHDLKETKNELKGDIHQLRNELKGEIQGVKTDLKGDITRLESKIGNIETNIKWLIAISLVVLAVLLTPTVKAEIVAITHSMKYFS